MLQVLKTPVCMCLHELCDPSQLSGWTQTINERTERPLRGMVNRRRTRPMVIGYGRVKRPCVQHNVCLGIHEFCALVHEIFSSLVQESTNRVMKYVRIPRHRSLERQEDYHSTIKLRVSYGDGIQ